MGKPKGAWNSPSVTAATSVDLAAYLEGNSRGLTLLGGAPPLPEEVMHARKIMDKAPTNSALDFARYFQSLMEVNKDGERYQSEWKIRANPVIVAFFSATTYGDPKLDQVA
jgi:hypothetical protein